MWMPLKNENMNTFPIPGYTDVSDKNRKYFDFFNKQLGSLPNLYATLAHSDSALEAYWMFHNHSQSLTIPEKEIIGLVVGSINESSYCLETHSMIARLNGFSEEQIYEIKKGSAKFDKRYDAFADLVYSIVTTKGRPDEQQFLRFFEAGYTQESLVDILLCIGDSMITNLLTCSMRVPSDFPTAGRA
jgi:AhpD family alkylhydroperoxidase